MDILILLRLFGSWRIDMDLPTTGSLYKDLGIFALGGFLILVIVAWIGIISLKSREADYDNCIANKGTPILTKSSGYVCFKSDVIIKD